MLSCFHLIPERHRWGQTDRRTDRIAILISRVSVLTRDKNLASFINVKAHSEATHVKQQNRYIILVLN